MATKLYVVCEYGWEYDDNYFYQGENNGSEPRKAYKCKEKAEAHCKEWNIASLKENWGVHGRGIAEHCSGGGWDNFVNDDNREALFKLFNEHDVKVTDERHIEFESPDDLPDEFFAKVEELCNLSFFCVTEVEAELK